MKIETTTTAKQVQQLSKDQVFHMLQCAEACLAKQTSEHAALVSVAERASFVIEAKNDGERQSRLWILENALANLAAARK